MTKKHYTLSLDTETVRLLDEAAKLNGCSRSSIARMLLFMIHHLPAEKLQETSPVPELLGISKGGDA